MQRRDEMLQRRGAMLQYSDAMLQCCGAYDLWEGARFRYCNCIAAAAIAPTLLLQQQLLLQ
jgi:hypothetical protein